MSINRVLMVLASVAFASATGELLCSEELFKGLGGSLPSPRSPSEYSKCVQGAVQTVPCPNGQYFDTHTRKCLFEAVAQTGPADLIVSFQFEELCNNPNVVEIFPNPTNCSQYIICYGLVPIEQTCGNGLLFNPQLNTCDIPSNVICGYSCPAVDDPYNPVWLPDSRLEDCSRHYLCFQGNPLQFYCYNNLYFDIVSRTCTYPQYSACSVSGVYCSTNSTMNVANPRSCTSYYVCEDGFPHFRNCAFEEYFSEALGVCIPGTCEPGTTTTSGSTTYEPSSTTVSSGTTPSFTSTTDVNTPTTDFTSTTDSITTSPSVTTPELTSTQISTTSVDSTTMELTTSSTVTESTTFVPTTPELTTSGEFTTPDISNTPTETTSEVVTESTSIESSSTQEVSTTTTSFESTTPDESTTVSDSTTFVPTTPELTTSSEITTTEFITESTSIESSTPLSTEEVSTTTTTFESTTPDESTTFVPTTPELTTTEDPSTSTESPTTPETTSEFVTESTSIESSTPSSTQEISTTTTETSTSELTETTTVELTTTSTDSTTIEPETTATTEMVTIDPNEFCAGLGAIVLPYPGNCYMYVMCINGVGGVLTCAAGTIFNPVSSTCVPGNQETCTLT